MNRHLVLFEEVPAGWKAAPGDVAVALTPRACFELEELGQPYRIPSDLGTEEHLRALEEAYFQGQLAWFGCLSEQLHQRIPELRALAIPPAFLYGYPLKLLLDNRFIRAAECAVLLEDRLDRVTLWSGCRTGVAPGQFFAYCLQQDGAYAEILSALCTDRGIPLGGGVIKSPRRRSPLATARALRRSLRRIGWGIRGRLQPPSDSGQGLTLFFLETQADLGDLLRSTLRAGSRCLIWDKAAVRRSPGRERGIWGRMAEELFCPSSSLWDWPREWWKRPVEGILARPLKAWVQKELPECLRLFNHFRRFYEGNKVDFVVAPAIRSTAQAAAVAACRPEAGTQSVLIAHGDGGEAKPAWDLFELFPYQHYFVPDSEFADHFSRRRLLYRFPVAQVHVGSYRWHRYALLRRELGPVPAKPVIVYPCCQPEKDVRYLNVLGYSESWYHRLQTRLIEVLSEFPEYTIVVKLFPGDDPRNSAIGKVAARLGKRNVQTSVAPFAHWLSRTDRVLLDFPSTPLYETALAGVAFHLLIPQWLPMRPSTLERFRGCLTVFHDVDDAAEAVRQYLSGPPTTLPKIKPEGKGILAILAELRGKPTPCETDLERAVGVAP